MNDTVPKSWSARLAAWPARHPWPALLVALLLGVLAYGGIHRLAIDSSIQTLLDPTDPAAAAMVDVMQHFSSAENLLVMVSVPRNADSDANAARLLAYAARFKSALEASPQARPLIQSITYQPDEQARAFVEKVLVPGGMFYLDDEAFAAAKKRLTPAGMAEQIRRNEAMLAAPGPAANALSAALLKDPLRLHEFLLAHLKSHGGFLSDAVREGTTAGFFSPDGQSLLIRIAAGGSAGDIDFAKKITAAVGRIAQQTNTTGLEIDITGAYAIAAASEHAIRGDMIASVIGSILCLQLLFILAYRRPIRSFLLAFLPVALGILYGFGVYSIFSRSLSPSTAVLGAILAGLGIDYAVLYLSRYLTTRAAGDAPSHAASTTLTLAPALLAACITSVIGFGVIGGSPIQALRDFAFVGSLGLVASLAAVLWVLPALLALIDRLPGSGLQDSPAGSLSPETRIPNPESRAMRVRLSAEPLLRAIARHPRKSIALSTALFIAALGILFSAKVMLPLESDMTVMHPRPNAPLEAQARLARRFGADPSSLLIHLQASSPQKLLELAHDVQSRLSTPSARQAGVSGTFGLAALLPDPRLVSQRRAVMTAAQARTIVADFNQAIVHSAFDAQAYQSYAQFLLKLLDHPHAPTIVDLVRYPSLAGMILSRSTIQECAEARNPNPESRNPTYEAITLLSLSHSLDQRTARTAAIAAVRHALANLPGATLTGLSVIQLDTEASIRRDLPHWLLLAGGLAAVYLLAHFSLTDRPRTDIPHSAFHVPHFLAATLLALLPAIFSLACRLAFMHVADQKLNLMNLIAIPLLIGIDVDYGIFLVSLARKARRDGTSPVDAMASSAHAICISAFSTILGFGSLVTTSVPAIRSLGWAMSVGVATCLFATLFLLAPILILRGRKADGADRMQRV
jgi:predicted RND superfamily exporter protein